MAKFIFLLAALASVQGSSLNRIGGWGPAPTTVPPPPPTTAPPPPPTTTPGWSPPVTEAPTTTEAPPPPTTAPPPPPTTTPGWSPPPPPPPPPSGPPPPPPPPPSSVTIGLTGELAAAGSGSAAENHAESIQVSGGWGVPVDLLVVAGGDSDVAQAGSHLQDASIAEAAVSLNAVSVGQAATADESLAVIASGLDVLVGQSGWAGVSGEAASSSAADSSIVVIP